MQTKKSFSPMSKAFRLRTAGLLAMAACIVFPLSDRLQADIAPCVILSAGAETDAATGSVLNVGQTLIGRADNGNVFLHAGGIPCLAVQITCVLGDVNGDGLIDGLDVAPFVDIKLTGIGTPRELCAANIDNMFFVSLLLGS